MSIYHVYDLPKVGHHASFKITPMLHLFTNAQPSIKIKSKMFCVSMHTMHHPPVYHKFTMAKIYTYN